MKKTLLNISLLAAIHILATSCSDFLDKTPTEYSSVGFYQSEAAIQTGVSGVYNSLYIDMGYLCPFNVYMEHIS